MTTDSTGDASAPDQLTYLNLANYVYNSGNVTGPLNTGTQFSPLYDSNGIVDKLIADDGFFGQAFIENHGSQPSQLVISFEGTNFAHNPPKHLLSAQIKDDDDIVKGIAPQSFTDALNFANSAISIAEADDNVTAGNIYLDGHSLGGAEAEYVSSQLKLPGATFGAPGISLASGNTGVNSGLIDYVAHGDPVGNYAQDSVLGGIVPYLPNGMAINHYGKVQSTGNASNDTSLMQATQEFLSGDKPAVVARFLYGFLKYHVLSSYASDLGYTLSSDDNSKGADLDFFAELPPPQLYGSTGPGECFVAGTRLMTPHGARAIETITPGDVLVTTAGTATVIWVGRRRLDVAAHPRPAEVSPIRIAAHAFADNIPARDLLVSPGHGLAVDGALIPARLLVNGSTIVQVEVAHVDYRHVELARHDLVLAEGLAAETYMDCGNRAAFEGGAPLDLHPSFTPALSAYASMEDACLPWIVAGPALETARARLAARAEDDARRQGGSSAMARRQAA